MWHVTVFAIFYICLIFSPDVKASCLEYGHSCWGAHGKRSSGPANGGNKAQQSSGNKNLRSYELPVNVMSEDNRNQKMENKFDNDEAFASAESLLRSKDSSAEDNSADVNNSAKKRSRNNFMKFASESDSSNSAAVDDGKRRSDGLEERQRKRQQEKQHKRERHQQSISLQQQRKYPQHAERWRRFPFYASRLNTFDNSPLTLTVAATPLDEIQTRNTENDFIQQLGQLAKEDQRLDDVDAFYDFL